LTLITYSPFFFVGSAPDRFIVRVRLLPHGEAYIAIRFRNSYLLHQSPNMEDDR
jgi:hypothetical protein